MKRKIARFIKNDGIQFLVSLIVLLIATVLYYISNDNGNFVDWTIFTSVVIAIVLSGFSKIVSSYLMTYFEDEDKLNVVPVSLVNQYQGEEKLFIKAPSAQGGIIYPVKKEGYKHGMSIEIFDSLNRYSAPDFVQENFNNLFKAHGTSSVYNQLNIRVDDWFVNNEKFSILTSRTTYFDSLVTNRAMDYQLDSGLTVRSKLAPGPFTPSLKDSLLSNHLGFNGHIESSDGWILMVKRGKNLSIGKSTYGNSVGASLKSKYALLDKVNFSTNGLLESIKYEIFDEVKIERSRYKKITLEENIIGFYRDFVEGGKPQFLFYIKVDSSRNEIERIFNEKSSRSSDRSSVLEDGDKLAWINRKDLSKIRYLEDGIEAPVNISGVSKNRKLKMFPSAIASLIILQEYLEELE